MFQKPVTVIDNYSLASEIERIIAFAIDYILALALISLPHRYGFPLGIQYSAGAVSMFYLFFKDCLPFIGHRSIGKRLVGTRVVLKDNLHIGFLTSFKRNIIFLPNFLLLINYDFFHYIVLMLNGAAFMMEIYLIYTSSDNQRLGDNFAETVVIEGN